MENTLRNIIIVEHTREWPSKFLVYRHSEDWGRSLAAIDPTEIGGLEEIDTLITHAKREQFSAFLKNIEKNSFAGFLAQPFKDGRRSELVAALNRIHQNKPRLDYVIGAGTYLFSNGNLRFERNESQKYPLIESDLLKTFDSSIREYCDQNKLPLKNIKYPKK